MRIIINISIYAICIVLTGCATSQQTTNTNKDGEQEIYVFDDAGISDTTNITEAVVDSVDTIEFVDSVDTAALIIEDTVPELPVQFIVQVGAFTTIERAQKFVDENQSKINWQMSISYSEKVRLHVVQLPPFSTRSEAEFVRNQLWQSEYFKDAFIVPEN
ncbi:SPOR domain-containing protein [Bacteroidota bacterium]